MSRTDNNVLLIFLTFSLKTFKPLTTDWSDVTPGESAPSTCGASGNNFFPDEQQGVHRLVQHHFPQSSNDDIKKKQNWSPTPESPGKPETYPLKQLRKFNESHRIQKMRISALNLILSLNTFFSVILTGPMPIEKK